MSKDDKEKQTDLIIVINVIDANTLYVLPYINNDLDFDIIETNDMPLVLSLVKDKDNKNALLHKDNKNNTIKLLARSILNGNVDIIYNEMSSDEAEMSLEDYALNNENELSNLIKATKNSP